jgi:chromosome segregation ATPase
MPSKAAQATRSATQQAKKIRKEVSDNLLALDEKTTSRANPGELNKKIGQIDADLDGLRKKLNKTNKDLKDNLTQLSSEDADLRTQVTQAYQQLGELDDAYKTLSSQSLGISKEIKAVTKRINEVSKNSDEKFDSLGEEYQALAQQVEELATKSKKTTQDLNKSIKANAQAMKELEQKLLNEIDDLANASRERDDSLEQKTETLAADLNKADEEIRASQAKMLKMQAIDQALEKRAESLESTTTDLTKKSRELTRSTTVLNNRTQEMSQAIAALQETAEEHTAQISGLQERTEKTDNVLYAVIMKEKRHFRLLGVSLVLLLLALVGYSLYNQNQWWEESTVNNVMQSDIKTLDHNIRATDNKLAAVDVHIDTVKRQSSVSDKALKEEISTISQKLSTIGDQVDTLDGRMNNLRPHRTFGNGNVIHGPDWVARQDANQYVIHLATPADKQDLYKLAERYSRYLKDDLAYLPVTANGSQRFALIYGSYESEAEANSALSRMPRYIERQRPMVHQMARVQGFLPKDS